MASEEDIAASKLRYREKLAGSGTMGVEEAKARVEGLQAELSELLDRGDTEQATKVRTMLAMTLFQYGTSGKRVGNPSMTEKQQVADLLHQSAVEDDPEAQLVLGRLLIARETAARRSNPDGSKRTQAEQAAATATEGTRWIQLAASAGLPEAQFELAMILLRGPTGMKEGGYGLIDRQLIPEPDAKQAGRWMRRAAEQDHPIAAATLAKMHAQGTGVRKSHRTANKWMRRAAEKGHADSQLQLGLSLAHGFYSSRGPEPAKALPWLQRAAAQGNSQAQFAAGVLLAGDEGPTDGVAAEEYRNPAAAAGYYHLCGEMGSPPDPKCVYNLARMLQQGRAGPDVAVDNEADEWEERGVAANSTEAARLFELAAAMDDPATLLRVGLRYAAGDGVEKSDERAVDALRRAANAGDLPATAAMADMLYAGRGVEAADPVLALRLAVFASDGGVASAQATAGLLLGLSPWSVIRSTVSAEDQERIDKGRFQDGMPIFLAPEEPAERLRLARKHLQRAAAHATAEGATADEVLAASEAEAGLCAVLQAEAAEAEAAARAGSGLGARDGIPAGIEMRRKARQHCETGAAAKDVHAMLLLSQLAAVSGADGRFSSRDKSGAESLRWVRKAIDTGDSLGWSQLHPVLMEHIGLDHDFLKVADIVEGARAARTEEGAPLLAGARGALARDARANPQLLDAIKDVMGRLRGVGAEVDGEHGN